MTKNQLIEEIEELKKRHGDLLESYRSLYLHNRLDRKIEINDRQQVIRNYLMFTTVIILQGVALILK
jgi:hypothetical protein